VEVGPRSVLTGLVGQILGDRPHVAVSLDAPDRPGLPHLLRSLARLAAHGADLRFDRLFEGREPKRLDLDRLVEAASINKPPPTTWMVNGGRARPWVDPPPASGSPVPHIGGVPATPQAVAGRNGDTAGAGRGIGSHEVRPPAGAAPH